MQFTAPNFSIYCCLKNDGETQWNYPKLASKNRVGLEFKDQNGPDLNLTGLVQYSPTTPPPPLHPTLVLIPSTMFTYKVTYAASNRSCRKTKKYSLFL